MAARSIVASAAYAAIALAGNVAVAQTTDSALAAQLFVDGQALMTQRKFAEACPKLAESQRLEPKLGTLLNLATCHEEEGKVTLAWSEFTDAEALAARAKRADRVEFARAHAAALERRIARIRFVGAAPNDLQVVLDGRLLQRAAIGSALPVDPGAHAIELTAPGKKRWSVSVDTRSGQESTVNVPALEDDPTAASAGSPAPSGPTATSAPLDEPSSSAQRPIGFAIAGVGAAGVALGAVFGAMAISKEGDARGVCPDPACATQEGVDLHDAARSRATVSTIALIAGGALFAGGLVLALTAPKAKTTASLLRGTF